MINRIHLKLVMGFYNNNNSKHSTTVTLWSRRFVHWIAFTTLLMVGVDIVSQAQDFHTDITKSDFQPPSPEASSLGKYGQYEVNYSTGLPSIGIPIYNVQVGNFTLPIGLSYHGGGVKVTEIASRVGLGWSLNAGGVVTSNIIGKKDGEISMPTNYTTFAPVYNYTKWNAEHTDNRL